jgi:hypothetical protein
VLSDDEEENEEMTPEKIEKMEKEKVMKTIQEEEEDVLVWDESILYDMRV